MGKVGKNPESAPIRLGQFRNQLRKALFSESTEIVRSHLESSVVAQSRPELFGVVHSRSRPGRIGSESSRVVRSRPESFGVVRSRSQ